MPQVRRDLLCVPGARVASVLSGGFMDRDAAGYPLLYKGNQAQHVGESCSGADFFTLLAALLYWVAVRRGMGMAIALVPVLLAAYGGTLLANSSRLVCLAWATPVFHAVLPPHFQTMAHFGIGVFVFLPCLLCAVLLSDNYVR